jgi:ATP/maltotriose-dependent transcriptional regulator MalT
MIRRAISETAAPLKRAPLLPAYVEIMIAVGDVEAARTACRELDEIAERHDGDALQAMSAHTRGATALAGGDAPAALADLRRACRAWQELGAPLEAARARALIGVTCRGLDDTETAELELEAARGVLTELGASPALAWAESLASERRPAEQAHGLTGRELEVLRLLATGKSNREIASVLVISEHTVARHVQNIFAKLRISSRTAASAFAFEHDLV